MPLQANPIGPIRLKKGGKTCLIESIIKNFYPGRGKHFIETGLEGVDNTMKKKTIGVLAGTIIILAAGGWYAKTLVTDKIVSGVSSYIADPTVQKELDKLVSSKELNAQAADALAGAALADGTSQGDSKAGSGGVSSNGSNGSSDGSKQNAAGSSAEAKQPAFKNRTEAVGYAVKKFSPSELAHLASVYKRRSSLTEEEKKQLKTEVLSKFTAAELKALLAASKQ
jgi:hypothetical protein